MEKEDKKIIKEILLSRPESKIDPAFISSLRKRILKESTDKNMFNFLFNRRFAYAFSGIALVALIAIVSVFYLIPSRNGIQLPGPSGSVAIKNAGQNAFGKILLAQGQTSSNEEKNGLNTGAASSEAPLAPQLLGRGGGGPDATVIAPIYNYNYKYVYKGGDFSIGDGKLDVYRKLANDSVRNSLSGAISGINLGFLNLSAFQNLKVATMEITEDRDSGYSIYLDGRSNTIAISMNWEKWPKDIYNGDQGNAISEGEAISIADAFIAKYGINLNNYGKGEVLKNWYKGLLPMDITVVYPLQIDGKDVYDQGGQKFGISVQVNSKLNKVTNVYGIEFNSLEKSQYDSEINEKQAIEIAEKGGMLGGSYIVPTLEQARNITEVELGTPELKLVKFWVYKGDGQSDELYIPSLIFPIINEPELMYFYRPNIVVPLVGSLAQSDGGPIRIMGGETGAAGAGIAK